MNKGKKRLLILGGISVLCDVVKSAKDRGYYVIVADYLNNSPAKKVADESWLISVDDVDGIVDRCIKQGIDGVMNYCIDPAQKPYQRICERLGIPCVAGYKQFDILTNKDKLAECCSLYGLSIVEEYDVKEIAYMNLDNHPVVIKPVDSRASKGLFVCNSQRNINELINESLKYSKRKKVLIQKYMECHEVMIKYLACEGEIFLSSMADIYNCTLENGNRVYMGAHIYPSKFYIEYLKKTNDKVVRMLKSIGVQNGAITLTAFYDEGTFRFFDSGLRMGGGKDWRIVKEICGIDIADLLTEFAIWGHMGDLSKIQQVDKAFASKESCILYINAEPGRINQIKGFDEISDISGVIDYHLCHKEGDEIINLGTADNVIGRIMIVCDNKDKLIKSIQEVKSKIIVKNDRGESMIAPVYNPNLWY